jgi:hypothetical protein
MDFPIRQCKDCSRGFPATTRYFYRDRRAKGGLRHICKDCDKARSKRDYAEKREARLKSKRTYDQMNAEQKRQWRAYNQAVLRSYRRKYYQENREHILARQRAYDRERRQRERSVKAP